MGGITGAAEGGRIGFAEGPMDPKEKIILKTNGWYCVFTYLLVNS